MKSGDNVSVIKSSVTEGRQCPQAVPFCHLGEHDYFIECLIFFMKICLEISSNNNASGLPPWSPKQDYPL